MTAYSFLGWAAVASALSAGPARAIDLDALSTYDRRLACVAYSFLDVEMRYQAGAIDKTTYDNANNQIVFKVLNRGDNFNYAPDFAKVDRYANRIIDEEPGIPEFAGKLTVCRRLLRL